MYPYSRTIAVVCASILALALTACATKPTTTYDDTLDFNSPKNYAWIDQNPLRVGDTSEQVNPFLQQYVMSATSSAMTAKGYSLVTDVSGADFVVAFTFGSRDQIRQDSYPGYVGMGPGVGVGVGVGAPMWGAPMAMGAGTTTTTYSEGQLSIDLFDANTKKPAWHGTYSHSISESDQKKLEESVSKAVNSIMDAFPPSPE